MLATLMLSCSLALPGMPQTVTGFVDKEIQLDGEAYRYQVYLLEGAPEGSRGLQRTGRGRGESQAGLGRPSESLSPGGMLVLGGGLREATLRALPDGSRAALVRREGNAMIGAYPPPLMEGIWNELPLQLGGPELVVLPSGGDSSYPGRVLEGSELLVSYYSSHEGKSAIYLARLRLGD